jgi:hypothetical protein
MNDKLSWVAAVAQSVLGTSVAVNPSTNFLQVSDFEITPNQAWDTIKILSGKFTSEPKVPGNLNATCKGKIPLVSGGVETPPSCDLILKAAGFTGTIDTTPTGGSKYIYTRSGNQIDLSMCKYRIDGANGITYNANSIMFNNLKISLESGKVAMLDFSGPGLAGGYNNAQPEVAGVLTAPTQVKIPYYAVNDVATTVLDTTYTLAKADFEIVNKIAHKQVMTGYGFGAPEVQDEESKFNFSVLINSSLAPLPFARMRSSQTPGAFSFTFGAIAGQRISIVSTLAQLQDVKESKTGEFISNDVSGEFIDNNLVITFNSDLT